MPDITPEAKAVLDLLANGGEQVEALGYKLAEFAWLQGWIAALTYLKTQPGSTAMTNPYTREETSI